MGRMLIVDPDNLVFVSNAKASLSSMFTKSVEEYSLFQSTKEMLKFYQQSKKRLCSYFDFVDEETIEQYIHDIFIYDRGKKY